MSKTIEDLISQVAACPKKKLSVAVAQDDAVLEAVRAAKEKNIADSILVGDEDKIRAIAANMNMDLTDYEIVDVRIRSRLLQRLLNWFITVTQICT